MGGIATLSQGWIVNQESSLFSVSHWPQEKAKIGVVLAPGFSQSMCDMDYFMSKMARRMNANGFYVLQIDLRGHGDSPGLLENVSMKSLREDLNSAICYAKKNVSEKVYCVGRGLSATLFSEFLAEDVVQGVAGISPYCIDPKMAERILEDISTDVCETADFFNGSNEGLLTDIERSKHIFLEALGANTGNLHGQKISSDFMKELLNYNAIEALKAYSDSTLWLFCEEQSKENILQWDKISSLDEIITMSYTSLVREPLWQHNVINRVCSWMLGD